MHCLSSVSFVNQPHTTINTELNASIRVFQIAVLVLYRVRQKTLTIFKLQ